jgi:hypothetical protein
MAKYGISEQLTHSCLFDKHSDHRITQGLFPVYEDLRFGQVLFLVLLVVRYCRAFVKSRLPSHMFFMWCSCCSIRIYGLDQWNLT